MYQLLYIDDDPVEKLLKRRVANAGFEVTTCSSAQELKDRINSPSFDYHVALVDYQLDQNFAPYYKNGIDITRALVERNPEIGVVGFSIYLGPHLNPGSGTIIADWLHAGAVWFCDKNEILSGDFERTLQILHRLAERSERWKTMLAEVEQTDLRKYKGLADTLNLADRIAKLPSNVLILGETGTGKELLARRIHERSGRSGPFVVGNCANLRGELTELILHGQEMHHNDPRARGFPKPGWFEQAHSGTLFLDEVGDMPLEAQASLLRVLQEKRVRRVLGAEEIEVDFRLLAATNHTLRQEAQAGTFREDLFFRLEVFPITVSPLRDRRQDIPELVETFRKRYCVAFGLGVDFDKDIVLYLSKRDYPGNVRELENLVQRFVALSTSSRPSLMDVRAIEQLTLSPLTVKSEKRAIGALADYGAAVAQWMELHLDEIGRSPDLRTKTAFVRAAIKAVESENDVPSRFPRTERYVLESLVRKGHPSLHKRVSEALKHSKRK
jgi:DNA-binding NtrC family response regulator